MKIPLIIGLVLLTACRENPIPKPYGYFRVDLPENHYQHCDTILPFSFDYASSSILILKMDVKEKNWIDIYYPHMNATIHCSYSEVKNNIKMLSKGADELVRKHAIKADEIREQFFSNPENRVYGNYYDILGNTASAAQFYLTDSIRHFFRGSVYFNHVPNKDSIGPMANYIRRDVIRLMESFQWK
jgi:gliding motility-associated lipoprotein GldD